MSIYDEISALTGAQRLPDEEEALAQAAALRGQLNDANFLSLSTINPLAQFGKSQRESVMNTAQTRGGLNRALAEEQRKNKLASDKDATMFKRTLAEENRLRAEKQNEAKLLADAKGAERTKEVFWHPTQEGAVLNLERKSTGEYFDQNGEPVSPEMVAGLVPYKLGDNTDSKQGSTQQKREQEKKDSERDLILEIDFIGNALSSPLIQAATGPPFDVVKQLARFGFLPDVQSAQTDYKSITAVAAEPLFSKLGVNLTDRDLEIAFDTVPSTEKEPQVWRDWYANRHAPLILARIKEGSKPELAAAYEAQVKRVLAEMDKNIAANKAKGMFKLPQTSLDADAAQSKSVDDLLEKY